jgi:hypothetical protein
MGRHPPQFFGGFGGDGLQHIPPDMAAHMFPDSHMFFDDPQDPKRRRIAKVRWGPWIGFAEENSWTMDWTVWTC